jgi:beta-lactamase regulating signal transducer with metallopeptidase domain
MHTLTSILFAYALNALWQLPLLVLAAEAAVRLLRGLRAKIIHRVWLGCLFLSLASPCLPLLHDQAHAFNDLVTNPQGKLPRVASAPVRQISVHLQPSLSGLWSESPAWTAEHPLHLSHMFSRSICFLYIASVVFASIRLGWSLWRTHALLQGAKPAALESEFEEKWKSCLAAFGQERVKLLSSCRLSSPATISWPGPIVILPVNLHNLQADELTAAFCHELAHIRRRDFLCNVFYEFFGVLLFFHPALHWIRRRIQETRELACDDMAADRMTGRNIYARKLLQLTQKMRSAADITQPSCALGIFEGEIMEKRIMNLIETKSKQPRLRLFVSVALIASVVVAACLFSATFGFNPIHAQAANQANRAPAGWFMAGSNPANYSTGVDQAATKDGEPSACLVATVPTTNGFGTLMQSISATNYAGKRVRLRAFLKSQDVADWAGIWMRVDKEQTMVGFDNMQDRAIKGTQPWRTSDVVLDVPPDATSISFGVLLSGSGEVWMNHVTFEVVGQDVETTGAKPGQKPALSPTPVNLKFNE